MSSQVLFVDDDPLLLASLGRCLQDRYDLETFESAQDALAHVESEGPAPVIVTDMRMPVMDGAQFVVKAREIAPQTQFLMLTGTPNDKQLVCRQYGDIVRDYLNKPCSPVQLTEAIDKALEAYADSTSEESGVPV